MVCRPPGTTIRVLRQPIPMSHFFTLSKGARRCPPDSGLEFTVASAQDAVSRKRVVLQIEASWTIPFTSSRKRHLLKIPVARAGPIFLVCSREVFAHVCTGRPWCWLDRRVSTRSQTPFVYVIKRFLMPRTKATPRTL